MLVNAEHTGKSSNLSRNCGMVTNLEWDAQALYDELYCGRGERENRIKEQQSGLFADRTSCSGWWAKVVSVAAVGLRICVD